MNLKKTLRQLQQQQLYRSLNPLPGSGAKFKTKGRSGQLNFCSNDYLNLSQHPVLKEAAVKAIGQYGTGATSSRLLSGHLDLHEELECKLAEWSACYPAALSFGSGYLCNIGVLQAILETDAFVLFDRLNHASLIDGLRLAQATKPGKSVAERWQRYKHLDIQDLETKLQALRQRDAKRPVWIVTESVFSMDGDIAPLREIGRLAREYSASWMVDEAHSVGIWGHRGGGLIQALSHNNKAFSLEDQALSHENQALSHDNIGVNLPDIVSANFAKALGSYGGFCLCSKDMKEFLVNFSRSLIYSTALPPASAAAALAGIQVIEQACVKVQKAQGDELNAGAWQVPESLDSGNWAKGLIVRGLGLELLRRTQGFYAELESQKQQSLLPLSSPIIPVILGDNQAALIAAEHMQEKGFYVKAIRTPTVPPNSARLRFSLGLGHTEQDLSDTARALKEILAE